MRNTDFTKSPEQIIIDLVNYDNGVSLTAGMLTFGTPTALLGEHNTQVIASATSCSRYMGSVRLVYNRVDLHTVPGNLSINFPAGTATRVSDLIPAINSAYKLNLTPADYIDGPLPERIGSCPFVRETFELVAAPGSLVFIGFVTLCLEYDLRPSLSDLLDKLGILHTLLNITLPSNNYINLI